MKQTIIRIIIALGLCMLLSFHDWVEPRAHGMDVYIQGVNVEWIKDRNWPAVLAGAGAGFLVHEVSHVLVAKANGQSIDWSWYGGGPYMLWSDGNGDDPYLWTARAGFIGELAVGVALNLLPWTRGTDFTLGYSAGCTIRLLTYNLHSGGDFDTLRQEGGNGRVEWFILTGMSTVLTAKSINDSLEVPND